MAQTSLSVLGTNGIAFFGTGASRTWAQMRALTSAKTFALDGTTFQIQSRSLAALGGIYEYFQILFQFDTSGISDATAAEFRINCTSISSAPDLPKSILFKGNCPTPFNSSNGLNRMLNWPSSPTPYSFVGGTPISTGIHSVTLNADGISDINSGHTLQVYLVEYHQGNDATVPTGLEDFNAQFNNTNLELRVTTPSDYMKISNGAVKILNGKVSL